LNGFDFFWGQPPKPPAEAKAVPKPKATASAKKSASAADSSPDANTLPAFVRSTRPAATKPKAAKP
jgi:hypothetical protein